MEDKGPRNQRQHQALQDLDDDLAPGPDLDENRDPDQPDLLEAPLVITMNMGCDICDVLLCSVGQIWYIHYGPIC